MTKTRPFLSTCYGYPSTTEVPPCCQAATKKLTFSTTSVLLLLNVPLSLSRGTVFRRPKNPRRGYRPKIAGILFVCNEPEGKYYTVPLSATRHCHRPPSRRAACSTRATRSVIAPNILHELAGLAPSYHGLASDSLAQSLAASAAKRRLASTDVRSKTKRKCGDGTIVERPLDLSVRN